MNGILLVDKPSGWTSFDVVNKVRYLVKNSEYNVTGKKRFPVGHTGTLDPLATGLLVLLLGKCTKMAPSLTKLDKIYDVTMFLGEVSNTGDNEGEKTKISSFVPSETQVQDALNKFVGDLQQVPPAFSAIKINGQRAYKLARAGKEVTLEPRPVRIESIEFKSYKYPEVRFITHVSSGTYIRSLVEDIGKELKTGAYMSELRRSQVGQYDIGKAMTLDNISADKIARHLIAVEG